MFRNILVTGGAGFVGSTLALKLKAAWPEANVVALDNLRRRGSELNIERLRQAGIRFFHGDVRNRSDYAATGPADLILECSADASVMGGLGGDAAYVVETNLFGTAHCLDHARAHNALVVFLSSSRVFPIRRLQELPYRETESRLVLADNYSAPGVSTRGISEEFPLTGSRSLYGATKLSSELLIEEYSEMFGLRCIVNRCGVLTGPWQMAKADQGVVALWVAHHYFGRPLKYIGFGGKGKQVRDFLHVDDLYELLKIQITNPGQHAGQIYNVGGGAELSFSLAELTAACQKVTGKIIPIDAVMDDRPLDIPWYITDAGKVRAATGWKPNLGLEATLRGIAEWISSNERILAPVLAQ